MFFNISHQIFENSYSGWAQLYLISVQKVIPEGMTLRNLRAHLPWLAVSFLKYAIVYSSHGS